MEPTLITRLLLFGLFGWCAEIVWTAVYDVGDSLLQRKPIDWRLGGRSYLWMLPIYGGGGLLFEIAHAFIASWAWPLRGAVYMVGCFVVEYITGAVIKLVTGKIPWDYSANRFHVHGLIRLDYAPVWFAFGLILERVEQWVRAAAVL